VSEHQRQVVVGEANEPVPAELPAGGAVGRPAPAAGAADEPGARNHG